ncbi:uncharacterized protein LOC105663951 isoform X2 [Megachile rotundata]|uniref:uncharacterized protein LOC105663951 isoform X2 n=1 Tax=Megachile rotundata TaxID=143995 RepID=UPI003FD1EBC7
MTTKSFNEATAFVTVINRVWALRNFTRPENKIKFFFSWLYNISVLCLSVAIILCVELAQFSQLDYETEGIVYRYMIILYLFGLTCILILGWYHSKDVLRYKELLRKVEEDLQALGSTHNYHRAFLQIVIFASFWLCAMIVVCALYVKWLKNKSLIYIAFTLYSYTYGQSVGWILLLDFKTNVFWIGIKFRETNKHLNALLVKYNRKDVDTISESLQNSHDQLEPYSPRSKISSENFAFNSTYRPQSTKTIFRQVRFVHQQLCCVTKILSKTFDSQLLIVSANTVVYVTIVCYYLCIEVRKTMSIKNPEVNLLTVFIIDAIFDFTKMCIVTRDCEYAMKQKIRTMIALFKDYDQTLDKIGLPKQYNSIYWFQFYHFGFGTTLVIVYSILPVASIDLPLLQAIFSALFFNFSFIVVNACNVSFCVWIRYLRLRFEQLNGLLRCIRTKKSDMLRKKQIMRMNYDLDNKMFDPFEDEDFRRNKGNAVTMSIVKRSHLELFKIANAASNTYGLQLLMMIATAYFFLTTLFYATYRIIWISSTANMSMLQVCSQLVVPVIILIFFGYQIFITSHNCGKVNSQAIVTGQIICKLYGSYACKILRAEIRNFTLQLVQNPLTFTVYGLFTMDRSFLLRVIQSISTYLVILIQVGDTVIQSVRTLKNRNYTAAVESL